jgi:hypothetical protein
MRLIHYAHISTTLLVIQQNTLMPTVLGTELSFLSRGRMTLGVATIFCFISYSTTYHVLQGIGDTYL